MAHSEPNNLLSKREEDLLIEAGKRVLLDGGYPNPDRVGCPGPQVLKALAEHKMELSEAEESVLHIGMCSPCFIEYTELRKQVERRKALELGLSTAILLIVLGAGVWLWRYHRFPAVGGTPTMATAYRPVTLDLRNWKLFRGEQPPSENTGPIQLPRGRLDLTIFLPPGSQPGDYEVRVSTESEKPIVSATGAAVVENGIAVIRVSIDLSSEQPGFYVFVLRRAGVGGMQYPLTLK